MGGGVGRPARSFFRETACRYPNTAGAQIRSFPCPQPRNGALISGANSFGLPWPSGSLYPSTIRFVGNFRIFPNFRISPNSQNSGDFGTCALQRLASIGDSKHRGPDLGRCDEQEYRLSVDKSSGIPIISDSKIFNNADRIGWNFGKLPLLRVAPELSGARSCPALRSLENGIFRVFF